MKKYLIEIEGTRINATIDVNEQGEIESASNINVMHWIGLTVKDHRKMAVDSKITLVNDEGECPTKWVVLNIETIEA